MNSTSSVIPSRHHWQALDGLRGVAILLVLMFHGRVPGFRGGFLGVDVFFVISGFLITYLLLKEWNRDHAINFRRFYLRRILRLIPALLLLLLFHLFVYGALAHRWHSAMLDVLVVILYSVNWARAFGWSHPKGLGHTWSLSIEEQFYILWPPLLYLLLSRIGSVKRTIPFIISGIVLCIFWRIWLFVHGASVNRVFNGLDTRADALLIGCLLAVLVSSNLVPQTPHWIRRFRISALISVGIMVILGSRAQENKQVFFFGFEIAAMCSALIILECVNSGKSFIKSCLEISWLVWIGRISYSLYLWHFPIFRYFERSQNMAWPSGLICGGTLSFMAATFSYYVVEKRFLILKDRL